MILGGGSVKECLLAYAILVPLEYVILGSNDHMFLRELCGENVRYILREIIVVFHWNKSRLLGSFSELADGAS